MMSLQRQGFILIGYRSYLVKIMTIDLDQSSGPPSQSELMANMFDTNPMCSAESQPSEHHQPMRDCRMDYAVYIRKGLLPVHTDCQ